MRKEKPKPKKPFEPEPDSEEDEEDNNDDEEFKIKILNQLSVLNSNLKRLYDNDILLDENIQKIRKENEESLNKIKEISVSDTGVSIKSFQALKDLNEILSNRRVKTFFGLFKKNNILRHVSYID